MILSSKANLLFLTFFSGMLVFSCRNEPTLFRALDASRSGIDFVNVVEEDDVYNVMEFMNIYTGAGVAAGDVNQDGLTDLYFSGNQNSGKLYLNRGGLRFEDVTRAAGLENDRWGTGVSMVDINHDGWLDIYVNVSGIEAYGNTSNLLYINQQDGTFEEAAAQWGIADHRQTMNASFFDYDGDLDLDLFLIVNPADLMVGGVNRIRERMVNGESPSTDVLYRNNGNGTFTDVSAEAGILAEGYSLGAAISDINFDGLPDIYVSNDFLTNDILYINQGDGTFRDEASTRLRHTSFASMGNDIADINNDGLVDIYVVDMLPEDNYRRKMIIPASNYNRFQMALDMGYDPQFTRNTLQLNNGDGSFSEIAWLSGISSTDWSWSPLWADYDNDGDRDLMVTNGFYRDLGNLDYIKYQLSMQSPMGSPEAKRAAKRKTIEDLKQVPLTDYLFENTGNLNFTDRSRDWGFTEAGFSNSACYADLDNDGDLELVINRLNATAQVFENTLSKTGTANYLRIKLQGPSPNLQAIGTSLWLYHDGRVQFYEHYPYRGYEGSMEPIAHFGLGEAKIVDSILVRWPNGVVNKLEGVGVNHVITLDQNETLPMAKAPQPQKQAKYLREDTSASLGLDFRHQENTFVDFDVQPLLPHMHSRSGPGLAVGDINVDGFEDLIVGGAMGQSAQVHIQNPDGTFTAKALGQHAASEDTGILLFDADADNDLDLYVASGGSASPEGAMEYNDRLYLNDGKGEFTHLKAGIPLLSASSSCVVAGDYDGDGDIDLFVGGRVVPGKYPLSPPSRLLRNETEPGGPVHFVEATSDLGIPLPDLGMVSAALWTDFDNDGKLDLIVTGEFMGLRMFRNEGSRFREHTEDSGIADALGWWNSLAGGDFDADGDIDYVAGNLGLNSRYKASTDEPLCIYASDFDNNGTVDPVMCYFVMGENYVAHSRDEMVRQIPGIRNRFQAYEDFAKVPFDRSFLPEELDKAYLVRSNTFASSYIENLGNGKFNISPLPWQAQTAPVYGLLPADVDGDGNIDILLTGNAHGVEPSQGPYDAFNGLLLRGDGKGGFSASTALESGLQAGHDAKSIVRLPRQGQKDLLVVGNNDNYMQSFRLLRGESAPVYAGPLDRYAIVELKDGSTSRLEFYYGQGYLSQSTRSFMPGPNVARISFFGANGILREEWKPERLDQ